MEKLPFRITRKCGVPQKCAMFCQRKKNCAYYAPSWPCITYLQLAPYLLHTVDSWSLRKCGRIKAKLFMMDDITDNDAVMGWKYGQNMQMGGATQMVSPMEQFEAALV